MTQLSNCLRCGHTDDQHGGGIGCDGSGSCRCSGYKGMALDPAFEATDRLIYSSSEPEGHTMSDTKRDLCRQCIACGSERRPKRMVVWRDADGGGRWVHPWCKPGAVRKFHVEWLPRVDWGNKPHWGIDQHRRGCNVKLGTRGVSLWWRKVR